MKMIKSYGFEKLLFFLIIISIAGCADRCEPPVLSADGTLVYPSKRANDVTAGISYYKNEDREKGEPLGVDTVFTLNEKDNIRTQILLSKNNLPAGKPMMFHLDWIGPDGRSFYTKRIDNTVNDVSPTVNSSVSLSPDKRVPGKYLLKVYYFRELIAEKHFTLITQHSVNHS